MCDQCRPTRPFRALTAEENFLSICDQTQRRAHNLHQAPTIWLPRSVCDGTDLRRLLTTAIGVLRRDGWRQTSTPNAPDSASCVEGTLCQARAEAGVGDWVNAQAFHAVGKAVGAHRLRDWNDTPGLTQADVEQALTDALIAAGGHPVPRPGQPPMPTADDLAAIAPAERTIPIAAPTEWQGFPQPIPTEADTARPEPATHQVGATP